MSYCSDRVDKSKRGQSLEGYTLAEMRDFLRSKGLKTTGSRKELCDRIVKSGLLSSFLGINIPLPTLNPVVSIPPPTLNPVVSIPPPTLKPPTLNPVVSIPPPTLRPPTLNPVVSIAPPTLKPPTLNPVVSIPPPTLKPPTLNPVVFIPPPTLNPVVSIPPPTLNPPTLNPPTLNPPTLNPPTLNAVLSIPPPALVLDTSQLMVYQEPAEFTPIDDYYENTMRESLFPNYPKEVLSTNNTSEVKCGFMMKNYYKISSLLCSMLSSRNLSEMLNGMLCGPISHKMAKNIIKVAAQRIFSDPFRSFVEPVTNSYDSYMEMRGKQHVGKFGMGFFSLLYWLNNKRAFLTILSSYKIEGTDNICKWKANIIYDEDEEEYYFILVSSEILPHGPTGTIISIENVIPKDDVFLDSRKILNVLKKAFGEIDDVHISLIRLTYGGYIGTYLRDVENVTSDLYEDKINIFINNYITSDLGRVSRIYFVDNARGMTLETLLGKLLLPTISTKTLEKFSLSSKKDHKPSRIKTEKFDRNLTMSLLPNILITVGDIGIFKSPVKTLNVKTYGEVYKSLDKTLIETYILSLPFNSPMPVSRDDVILDSKEFYDVVKKNLIDLIHSTIKQHKSIQDLLDLLITYVDYSGNKSAYELVSFAQDYISKLSNVYIIPRNTTHIFDIIKESLPDDVLFFEGNVVEYDKIKALLMKHMTPLEGIFHGRTIFIIDRLLERLGSVSLDANIPGILFVDKGTKEKDTWIQDVIISNNVMLSIYKEDEDFLTSLYDTIVSREDVHTIGHTNNGIKAFKDYETRLIYPWKSVCKDEAKLNKLKYILYNSLIRITNRNVEDTQAKYELYLGVDRFLGLFYYGKFAYYGKTLGQPLTTYKNIDYMLDVINLYFNSLLDINTAFITILNPMAENILFAYTIPNHKYLLQVLDILDKEHPIYYFYISYLIVANMNSNKFYPEESPTIVKFLLSEIKNKYTISSLVHILSSLANITSKEILPIEYATVINSNQIALDTYVNLIRSNEYIPTIFSSVDQSYKFTFTSEQLIGFVFEYGVNMNDLEWLALVPNFKPQHGSHLQATEIAVNDGTSKPFVEAVLTEMTQNSIDAMRESVPKEYYDNLNLQVGPTETPNVYVISLSDNIGIPIRGILSIMLPFLSTKSSGNVANTGEFGSGSFNYYRQPYTQRVEYETWDPETGVHYKLVVKPFVNQLGRVYNLEYTLTADRLIKVVNDYSTQINIYTNPLSEMEASGLIKDSIIYSLKYFPNIPMKSIVNGMVLMNENELVVDNEYGKVYARRGHIPISSVVLTNSVPYSELSELIEPLFDFSISPWIKELSTNNMIVDLDKSLYKAVQSRNKLILNDKDMKNVRMLIIEGILNKFYKDLLAGNQRLDNFVMGLRYKGDYKQVMPFKPRPYGVDGLYLSYSPMSSAIPGRRLKSLSYFLNKIGDEIAKIVEEDTASTDMEIFSRAIDTCARANANNILPVYVDVARLWFSTKNIERKKKQSASILEESVEVPVNIISFTNSIVRYAWKKFVTDVNSGLIVGFYIHNDTEPSVIFSDKIPSNVDGFYSETDHTININSRKLSLVSLSKSISMFKDVYKRDPVKGIDYFRKSKIFNKFCGIRNDTVTLVHELGHAIRNMGHSSDGSHSDWKYKIGNIEYKLPYNKGCNELWSRLIAGYVPDF